MGRDSQAQERAKQAVEGSAEATYKLNEYTERLDSREADIIGKSLKFTPRRQEPEKRAHQVQVQLIDKTRRSLGVSCAVEEVLKVAPTPRETFNRQQSWCIL